MVERFSDMKIRAMESILKNENLDSSEAFSFLFNTDITVSTENFYLILRSLEHSHKVIITDEIGGVSEEGGHLEAWFGITDMTRFMEVLAHLKKEYPKKKKQILSGKTTELIAVAIANLDSGIKLEQTFIRLGIDKSLIVYPNTKWRMVQDILDYLCKSDREDDKLALNEIFKEFFHPFYHRNPTQDFREFERNVQSWLQYEDYGIINGKLVEVDFDGYKSFNKVEDALKGQIPTDDQWEEIEKENSAPIINVYVQNTNNNNQNIQIPSPVLTGKIESPVTKIAPKKSLKGQSIIFDDTVAKIVIGEQYVQLPAYKNEHFFCRAIFEYKKDEVVDWSNIYEKMTGNKARKVDERDVEKEWRTVYDALRALNERVQDVFYTEDIMFFWSEKTVKRMF